MTEERKPKKRKAKKPAGNPWPARLKAFRNSYTPKLTQEEAAEMAGVTRRGWLFWERGDKIPSRPLAVLLSLLIKHPPERPAK